MSRTVGISGIFRHDQLAGGPYSYFENVLRGLAGLQRDLGDEEEFSLTVFQGAVAIPWQCEHVSYQTVPSRMGRFAAHAWVGAVGARSFDAVLFPNYFTPPIVRAHRAVTVIHDLQFRHLPVFNSPLKWRWLDSCHRFTLHKCDAVITVSETVRDDILNQYGGKLAARVHAIHTPLALERFGDGQAALRFTDGRPYIMCVAMDRPQKNLYTLIRAFDQIKNRFPEYVLVMAGQLRRLRPDRREKSANIANRMPSTEDLVDELGLRDRVRVTGFTSDAELGALDRGASAFVLPSLFEGFGMPAVEALAMGAPTLISDLPVLREVTLGGARYIDDPRCEKELAERIADILQDVEAARPSPQFIEEIRRHYSPQRIARQYLDVLLG